MDLRGSIPFEFAVANHTDVILAGSGELDSNHVRRLRVRGIANLESMRPILPAFVADRLGLVDRDEVAGPRRLVRGCLISILDRDGSYSAIIDSEAE